LEMPVQIRTERGRNPTLVLVPVLVGFFS